MTEQITPDNLPPDAADNNAEAEAATWEGTTEDTTSFPPEFSIKQRMLLLALVRDPNVQAAAKHAGIGRTMAYECLHQPAFQEELARRRNAMLAATLDAVKTHAVHAAERLAGLVETEDGRLCRLVCNDILERAIRIRELEDFGRRLAAVEKRLDGGLQKRP